MTTLSATIARLAKRHKLGKDASEPEMADIREHHWRCEAEYSEPLASVKREFFRRYGLELRRKP